MKKSHPLVILLTCLAFTGCASPPESAPMTSDAVEIHVEPAVVDSASRTQATRQSKHRQAASAPLAETETPAVPAAPAAPSGPTWSERATRAAAETSVQVSKQAGVLAARTASQVGESLGTAFRGVVAGFEAPDGSSDFGSFPEGYANRIRGHFIRFEGIQRDASFRIGAPTPGYMNAGLFQGGKITWRGYLVDVEIGIPAGLISQARTLEYVVRVRDGEIIEVHRASTASALRRAAPAEAASAAASPAS